MGVVLCITGDRYDAEPRSRSNFESTITRYDEDPRGPVRPYSDEDDEGFRDRPGTFKDSPSKDKDKDREEERKDAG